MTLQDFFTYCGQHPTLLILLFTAIPVLALILSLIVGYNDSGYAPWRYLFSGIVYLSCIPGVFAAALTVSLFIFERHSILQTDLLNQILPIVSMIVTLLILRRFVDLDKIPGFGKVSGLIWMISAAFAILWILDKTRIFVFTIMPFQYILFLLIGLLVMLRFGWKRLFGGVKS
jgi:hypothetical protein